jgi:hypothetical protein
MEEHIDEEILLLAKRIEQLSHAPRQADIAFSNLFKISEAIQAMMPRLEARKDLAS